MLLKNGNVFLGNEFIKTDVLCHNDIIAGIENVSNQEDQLECNGCYVLPGLVEIHSHGCVGEDFSTSNVEGIGKMCDYYAKNGITSVMATTMTDTIEHTFQAMNQIKEYSKSQNFGSKILGIHMEGPFLGKDKKGAHDENYLLDLDETLFEQLDKESENQIQMVSIDPNLKGTMDFIKKYKDKKTISLAHSSATYDVAVQAILSGANHITHLFNAMNPLHHREPGLIGAGLEYPCYKEIICDGIHIHPGMIRFLFQTVSQHTVLISDSMSAAGLCDGNYMLGGAEVIVKNGAATLLDGTIAGSTTNLYKAMCKAISFGVKPEQAIYSATYLPAKSVKKESEIGSIEIGKKADFLILDSDYNIKNVIIDGRRVK